MALNQITVGSDGNVWFTDGVTHSTIDRVTPDGTITQFPIPPTTPMNGHPYVIGLALEPSGKLVFTQTNGAAIGTITTTGQVTLVPIPPTSADPNPVPMQITAAPDGTLWWLDLGENAIGELTTSVPSITIRCPPPMR